MQLGAFYPFMRNHNALGERVNIWLLKEIFILKRKLGSRSSIILLGSATNDETSITHEIFSYSLLVYTSLWSHRKIKNNCSTTFFWVFPFLLSNQQTLNVLINSRYLNDPNTYPIDQQFLVGRALLISPTLLPVIFLSQRTQTSFFFIRNRQVFTLIFRKILGMNFHRVFRFSLSDSLLIWMHRWKKLMFMFAVVLFSQCRYLVTIWFLAVEIRLHYSLLHLKRAMLVEVYTGMMEILSVDFVSH